MKILIIGAGASGITASYLLAARYIDFEILEASDRYGGRVKKIEGFSDFPIDLGAEWVHKSITARPLIAKELLSGHEEVFQLFRYLPKTVSQYKNGTLRNRNWLRILLALVQDFKFVDSSWFDFVDRMVTPEVKRCMHLNSPITQIDYSGDRVVVTTDQGTKFVADKVLVTVPIKILQDESIQFIPAMPGKQVEEINREVVGDGIKVFIEFSERFYPDLLELGELSNPLESDGSYYDATVGKQTDRNVFALFAHGKKATKYTSIENDDKLIEFILEELDEMFDGQASKFYIKHVTQNWSDEPFIRGSYSMRKGDVSEMSAPLDEKVFFAGEAMHYKGKTIAVHGAIDSAYLAIDRMLS